MKDLLAGFEDRRIGAGPFELRCRVGGNTDGRALLLLHGYPETHVCWHLVAQRLAEKHLLVIPDLPGYGDSSFIEPDPDNIVYSKRSMAANLVDLMANLEISQFNVLAHDRGARVAYRMTLDHPDRVTRLAVLDIVPTIEEWSAFDKNKSIGAFHWPLLAQPAGLSETLIAADPDFFLDYLMARWAANPAGLSEEAMSEYRRCFRRTEVIRATCADYRAGATTDVEHDRADLSDGRRIQCPLLAVASAGRGDLTDVWERWADDVTCINLDGGHFLAEECPTELLDALVPFLQSTR